MMNVTTKPEICQFKIKWGSKHDDIVWFDVPMDIFFLFEIGTDLYKLS